MKIFYTLLLLLTAGMIFPCAAQNAVSGPVGLYGTAYGARTSLLSGGTIFVGNGGNWGLGGNIISADKGNPNSPTAAGQAEVITFDGTGTVSGAVTTPGAAGNYINGYAATTGTATTALVLPIGGASAVYPFTVPAGAAVTVGYFDGSGSSSNVAVGGTATTEFSEYFDLPSGWPAGSYSLAYPSGLIPGFNAVLSSATGANFSLAANIPDLLNTASTVVSASLPASGAKRLYLSTSPVVLPIVLEQFEGRREVGYNFIQWAVSDPGLVDRFELYRQPAGGNVFSRIYSTGAIDSVPDYSYRDLADTGDLYYQLSLIGKDGSATSSRIVFLPGDNGTSTGVILRPNPVSSTLTVTVGCVGTANFYFSILDMKGARMAGRLVTVTGSGTIQWDVSGFPHGSYLLNIRNTVTGKVENIEFAKL